MKKFVFVMQCFAVACLMAAVWGTVVYMLDPELALPVSVGIFILCFAMVNKTAEDHE